VVFQEADLNRRYPDGVYINLHGYPDFSPPRGIALLWAAPFFVEISG
jgi:hypothetical protein